MMDFFERMIGIVCAGTIFFGLPTLAIVGYYKLYLHREKWCEKCNSWETMRRETGQISGWLCPKCNWINQLGRFGCPTCGWYEYYEGDIISRRGPFQKVDKQEIDLFYGIKTTYLAYEDRLRCPKHGVFVRYLPVQLVDAYDNAQDDYYWEDG